MPLLDAIFAEEPTPGRDGRAAAVIEESQILHVATNTAGAR